jgi:uncharacterized protein YbgA (DUF1722 family)/uncharacterized protein YbbK (DUF523 family)
MNRLVRPNVFASRCLGFEACRWNGVSIPVEYIEHLKPYVFFVTCCPETEIGLGVPRDPVRIVEEEKDNPRLVQSKTGRDYTDKMARFSAGFLARLVDIDGFILKEASPSCGMKGTKVYPGPGKVSPKAQRGPGLFGGAVLERFPHVAVENEGRLRNFRIREHFYTRLFALARFRKVIESGAMSELVHFHASHKLMLTAYSQKETKILGKIVANPTRKHFPDIISDYQKHFYVAFTRPARHTSHINVLQHAMGFFKDELSPDEKSYFLDLLEQYRAKKTPLSACISVIKSWIVRFGQPWLADQAYLMPYPWELATISDSGKGRDL